MKFKILLAPPQAFPNLELSFPKELKKLFKINFLGKEKFLGKPSIAPFASPITLAIRLFMIEYLGHMIDQL
jgi:hypothetical protein